MTLKSDTYGNVWFIVLCAVLIIGILIGSFFDLKITKAFASQKSLYGKAVESFGEIIGYSVFPMAVSMLFYYLWSSDVHYVNRIICVIIAVAGVLVPSYFECYNFCGQAGYSWLFTKKIGLVVTVMINSIAFAASYFFIDRSKPKETLLINSLVIILGIIIAFIMINFILKGMWCRPRYRAMVWDNEPNVTKGFGIDKYREWWQTSLWKTPEWFEKLYVPNDYIKSWPSGHSSCASFFMCFPIVFSVLTFNNKSSSLAFCIFAIVYVSVVCIGRVRGGAHFLSDVCFGVLITVAIIYFNGLLVIKLKPTILQISDSYFALMRHLF